MFVLIRVLRIPLYDPTLHQRAWSNEELYAMFHRRNVYEQFLDHLWGRRTSVRPLDLDNECRLCFLECAEFEQHCVECGRNYHTDCVNEWLSECRREGAREHGVLDEVTDEQSENGQLVCIICSNQ